MIGSPLWTGTVSETSPGTASAARTAPEQVTGNTSSQRGQSVIFLVRSSSSPGELSHQHLCDEGTGGAHLL